MGCGVTGFGGGGAGWTGCGPGWESGTGTGGVCAGADGICAGLAPGGGARGVDSTAVGGATRACANTIPLGRLAKPASARTPIREYRRETRIVTALEFHAIRALAAQRRMSTLSQERGRGWLFHVASAIDPLFTGRVTK
jgi:hypothetical protein